MLFCELHINNNNMNSRNLLPKLFEALFTLVTNDGDSATPDGEEIDARLNAHELGRQARGPLRGAEHTGRYPALPTLG